MSLTHTAEIPLSNSRHVALIDAEDFERLSVFRWHLSDYGYARRALWIPKQDDAAAYSTTLTMHREVLGVIPDGMEVDHANGNRLDNRKTNLRLCNDHLQKANARRCATKLSSQYKGVYPSGSRWIARILDRYLGTFSNEADAARSYDAAAIEAYGSFARLNFPLNAR